MITKHGREFASNAELRRYEANNPQMPHVLNGCMCQMGECESCNRLVEAFEAMREALREVKHELLWITDQSNDGRIEAIERLHKNGRVQSQIDAALTLADAVSKVSR